MLTEEYLKEKRIGMELGLSMKNHTAVFDIEDTFDFNWSQQWMQAHWPKTVYLSVFYVIFIYFGQQYMKTRAKRFELRWLLALWNLGLATFSIIGVFRVGPELVHVLRQDDGFHHSVCYASYRTNNVCGFWAWAFGLSKVVELGDTVFIVLRKQPLIFLHWYHHITVMVYTWYSCGEYIAPSRWFISVNLFVHSFMYSYYGLRALGYRIPKPIAISITSIQLLQMVVGVTVNVYAYHAKNNGLDCVISYRNILSSLLMYSSYFVLFAIFFYNAYLNKSNKSARVSKAAINGATAAVASSSKKANGVKHD